jgi:predicted TIM-barrel fold metal-dependent hydrolase
MQSRIASVAVAALCALPAFAADPPTDIRELKLKDWQPRSMLVTKSHVIEKPKFPVIDIHNHLGTGKKFLTPQRVEAYLKELDEAGVVTVVDLDGMWDEQLTETIAALDKAHPGRFLTFAQINFDGIDNDDWSERETKRLEESFKAGARGLKFHKLLGLRYSYKDGRLVTVDDPKLEPIWETCGKYHKPVLIHVADPAAFFTPLDRFNERWHELNAHSNWLFYGPKFPKREDILAALHRVIAKHPNTTFINTHFGNNAEDIDAVAKKLDELPNMYVDIDARISELGRAPFSARRFFIKYADRVMFGTDTPPRRDAYRIYYRFLETDDEYFDCRESHHLQGFWNIYGVKLPDDVLEKIYYRNAARLLGIDAVPGATLSTKELHVKPTEDFKVTGDGSAEAWKNVEWTSLAARGSGLPYDAKIKTLYSKTGLYVLFNGSDKKLTASLKDGEHLWTQDVFECFLWPDESQPTYFEYEISPLGSELSLMVSNSEGKQRRWQPWVYEEGTARVTRKATAATDGEVKSNAEVKGWSAEVFIPYELLKPLGNTQPTAGTRWRANFYRVDYDDGKTTSWDWSRVGNSFHDFRRFGTLVFE